MCAFKVLINTLNISHGHKFTGLLGRRTQVKSFKLTSMSRLAATKCYVSNYPLSFALKTGTTFAFYYLTVPKLYHL